MLTLKRKGTGIQGIYCTSMTNIHFLFMSYHATDYRPHPIAKENKYLKLHNQHDSKLPHFLRSCSGLCPGSVLTSPVVLPFQVKSQQAEMMRILESKSIQFELIDISVGGEVRTEMRSKAGNPTAVPPQLFNEDQYCGVRTCAWCRCFSKHFPFLSPSFCCTYMQALYLAAILVCNHNL